MIILSRLQARWYFSMAVIAMTSAFFNTSAADEVRNRKPHVSSVVCKELQIRLEDTSSILKSHTMPDSEKLLQLSKIWARGLNAPEDEQENWRTVRILAETLARVLMTAHVQKDLERVPGDAITTIGKIKDLISPYLTLMKLSCPDLVVPEVAKSPPLSR